MLNLKENIENLVKEKKTLGLFKVKDKRAVQEKLDSTNNEIAQIQSHINPAIEKIQKGISQNESRINNIDTELTKPR